MAKAPLEVWSRSVRRAVRDYCRDRGQVPSMGYLVSRGENPRKLEAQMRLDILPAESRESVCDGMREEFESRFSASVKMRGDRFGGELVLTACDLWMQESLVAAELSRVPQSVAYAAPVSVVDGLGAWEETEVVDA